MTEASFRTEPCTSYTKKDDADRNHYNIPLVPWFRSNGQPSQYPDTFTPDIGYTTSFRSADYGPDYIFNKTDPFWPEEGNFNKGFGVRQRQINSFSKIFNYEISGGTGHWLPATMVRSISYYWEDVNGEDGAWAVQHIALILRNWRTDQKKTWGAYYTNSDTSTGVKKIDHNFSYVRKLGPDWFVYGVIFNIARAGVYAGSTPEARLADFRLGYEYPDLDSSKHRMVIGKEMSWTNLQNALMKGEMKFEPLPNLLTLK